METKSKILIVDDIEDNLTILGNILVYEGYAVQVAQDGETAIKVAEKKHPDLILLDIAMPQMTGFEVCKILKNNQTTKSIPVIFLTARTEAEDIVEGFNLGAVDYITKPFNEAELLARVKTHLDLTNAKRQLNQKNKQLSELNATKDKFFSIIAHDLRNPFNVIIGFSEILRDKIDQKDYDNIQYFTDNIHKSTHLVSELLNNLLEWSRLQTGTIDFKPQPANIQDLINNVTILLKANSDEKEQKIEVNVDKNLWVNIDVFMIETVLRNLVSNAIKYTNKNGEILIEAEKQSCNVLISIKDNGVGIEKDRLSKIFSIEKKNTTKGTHDEEGTGLGLILCKEFIDKHMGEIWAESETNKGTTFYIQLPLQENK